MPRIPFHAEDLETYGAWLSPDGYYTLASGGHAYSARKIAESKGWKIPPMTTIHDVMFDNGYYRVVFEENDVIFEYGVLQKQDSNLIAEAMSNVPEMPIFTSSTWNPGASEQSAGNMYKNLADFKAKNGMGAATKDFLRSELMTPFGAPAKEEEEEYFSAYASSKKLEKRCMKVPSLYASGRIPFDERAFKTYGAWLAPDGQYVLVGFEAHSEVGRDIIIENAYEDPGRVFKKSLDVYRTLGKQGYVRILFLNYDRTTVAFATYGAPAKPSLVVEAMRDFPEHTIQVQDKEYRNLEDFKARNGMMGSDAGIADALRSSLENSALMQAPEGNNEEEAFSAYAKTIRWLRLATKSLSVPFASLNAYGAWLSPHGTYIPVEMMKHAAVAEKIIEENGWSVQATPHNSRDYIGTMLDHDYIRVVFWKDDKFNAGFRSKTTINPSRISAAMSNFEDARIHMLSGNKKTEYESLADFKMRNGLQVSTMELLRRTMPGPGKEDEENAYAPGPGRNTYAKTSRWLKENTMFWYKQAGLFEEEMLSRNPRSQVLANKLRAVGLVEIGSRYGKAGVQYGIEGKARRVSIGARDVMLNYLLVQGRDSRWNMYKSFSLKKVLEHPNIDPILKEWADWVGRGPTMIEVREKQRERAMSDQYASATGLEKSLNPAPQAETPPPVQPAPPPQPEQPGTERQASKGTPTSLNLWVLKKLFKDKDEVPNQLDPTDVTHLRRCMGAGLIEAVGGTWRDVAPYRKRKAGHPSRPGHADRTGRADRTQAM